MNCTKCGDALEPEEEEYPNRDRRGEILCDKCYEDKYCFVCPICEEMFTEDFSKDISPEYLLVSEGAGENLSLAPGIYKITTYPFFRDGMIEISLIKTAISRIADLPKGNCENDIHYVCKNCVDGMLK